MRSIQVLTFSIAFLVQSSVWAASAATSPTEITHTLKFGLSNVVCDSVRSPQQCLDYLVNTDEQLAPVFLKVSTGDSKKALGDIQEVMNGRVSFKNERTRWEAIRDLAVGAREVVWKLNDPRTRDVPERKMPTALTKLNSSRGISKIEVVHRFLVSGDRLLVDHQIIDRTSDEKIAGKIIATSRAGELPAEQLIAKFGQHAAVSLKTIADEMATPTRR